MFGDSDWDSSRTDAQRSRLKAWLSTLRGCRLAVVECGAGTAIATVRLVCEDLAEQFHGTLVRVNPREPDVPTGQIPLPLKALEALRGIDGWLKPVAETPGEPTGPP